jgi:hypothetical protein
MISIISSPFQRAIESLHHNKLTLPSEEVPHSQLAKDNMIVVFDFFSQQLLLPINERFRCVIGLGVVKCFVDGKLLRFSTLFLLSLWLVQRKILGLLFDVEVLDRSSRPVYVNNLQIPVCYEEQLANFLPLID